jgi:succinyl-CoA synthetase alpha subunit
MSILLDSRSRVLVQGLGGRQARAHVGYMTGYGTNVVAGVTPGKGGATFDGIPCYDSVRAALAHHEVDISVLFVPARFAADAALEAVECGVPLVVVLAEGVPHHDTALLLERADQGGVRVIGPNSQGMISPGEAKLGGTGGAEPDKLYAKGPVGVISRSGGMGGEIANALSRRGIGQSTFISIGGDLMIGTGFAPLLELFESDEDTRCVVMFGEAGTGHEEEAAALVREGRFTKPLVALVAGESMERLPKGMSFGHTSTIIARGVGSPARKKQLLRDAGARVADTFADLPVLVEQALAEDRTQQTEIQMEPPAK